MPRTNTSIIKTFIYKYSHIYNSTEDLYNFIPALFDYLDEKDINNPENKELSDVDTNSLPDTADYTDSLPDTEILTSSDFDTDVDSDTDSYDTELGYLSDNEEKNESTSNHKKLRQT